MSSSQISQTQFGLAARGYSIKQDRFNTSSVNANTNFFTINLFPDIFPVAQWNLYITPVASGILSIKRTQTSSAITVTEQLNAGTALVANSAYIFSFFVSQGESINLQYSVNSVISKLVVQEILS